MKTYLVLTLIASGAAAFAHSGVTNPDVMNRMMGMSEFSRQLKVIGNMAKGETTFDAKSANAALETISEEASYIPDLFKPRATDPKSEAKEVIWEEVDMLTERAHDLREASASMAGTVDDPADLRTALQEVGKTCSACHWTYRLEESK